MSSPLGLKIEKLLNYVGSTQIYFFDDAVGKLLKKRDKTFVEAYNPARDVLEFHACECRDSEYNGVFYDVAVSRIGEAIYSKLYMGAVHKGSKEYQEIEDQKRMKKIEEFTRAKVFGQSISFITEDSNE